MGPKHVAAAAECSTCPHSNLGSLNIPGLKIPKLVALLLQRIGPARCMHLPIWTHSHALDPEPSLDICLAQWTCCIESCFLHPFLSAFWFAHAGCSPVDSTCNSNDDCCDPKMEISGGQCSPHTKKCRWPQGIEGSTVVVALGLQGSKLPRLCSNGSKVHITGDSARVSRLLLSRITPPAGLQCSNTSSTTNV